MPLKLSPSELKNARTWYLIGGVALMLVGLLAMVRPGMASLAIEQLIGIVFIVSGVVLLFSAAFGKAKQHRAFDVLSSVLRVLVGVVLIAKALAGVIALTIIVAAAFIVEGVFGLVFAFKLRGKNPAWGWMLANAIAAFVLGGMLLAKFPTDAAWAIGLLFGINCAFLGVSLVMFAVAMPRADET